MPLYEYDCDVHGVFEAMGRMTDSAAPGACPSCARPAARILSHVRGAQLERSQVVARDRNERSRHEPRVVTRAAGSPHSAQADQGPRLRRAHGSRPWAIEHGG